MFRNQPPKQYRWAELAFVQLESSMHRDIRGKLTKGVVQKPKEIWSTFPPALADNILYPKMQMVRDNDEPNIWEDKEYDHVLFIADEVVKMIGINSSCKFLNDSDKIIKLNKEQQEYINGIVEKENFNVCAVAVKLRNFSLDYAQKKKKQQIQRNWITVKKEVNKTKKWNGPVNVPSVRYVKPYDDIIPTSLLFIPEMLIGLDFRNKKREEAGKVKTIITACKYDIVYNEFCGESNILSSYYRGLVSPAQICIELNDHKNISHALPSIAWKPTAKYMKSQREILNAKKTMFSAIEYITNWLNMGISETATTSNDMEDDEYEYEYKENECGRPRRRIINTSNDKNKKSSKQKHVTFQI